MPGRQFYSPMLLSSDQYSTFFWHAQLVTYKLLVESLDKAGFFDYALEGVFW